ncbi:MAG: hypothetical protein VZQ98_05405 [Bacteroidales bacterium]|nr:hypothetical protein [Bacteroidales bacterium]
MENEKREIDLVDVIKDLFESIKKLVTNIFSFLGWILRLIYHEKIIMIIFCLIGCLAGYYVSRTKIYRAEVELRFNANHDAYFYKNMVDPLYNQCKYRDINSIAQHFKLSETEAASIVNIQSFYYVDVLIDGSPNYIDYNGIYNALDTSSAIMPDRLRLLVDCTDSTMFKKMEDAFTYFFSENPQIVKENELRRNQLNEKISATTNEIVMLDSLRKREYFVRKRDVELSTDKMVVVEREMKLYHNEILTLENMKQQLVWDRDVFEDGVCFTNHFEYNPHPINSRIKMILIFGLIFLTLGFIVSVIKVKKDKVFTYLKKDI